MRTSILRRFVLLPIAALLVSSLFYQVRTQELEKVRTVQSLFVADNTPIRVVKSEINGKKLDSRNSVRASADWLKNLTVSVRNLSTKNISFIHIDLNVPKQGQMSGSIAFAVLFGSRSIATDNNFLPPAGVTDLRINDEEFFYWDKRLRNDGVEDIERVFIDIRTVHFDDGTGWHVGSAIIRDPNNPKRWLPAPSGKSVRVTDSDLMSWFQKISVSTEIFFRPLIPTTIDCGYGTFAAEPFVCLSCTDEEDTAACDRFMNDSVVLFPPGTYGFLDRSFQDRCKSETRSCSSCSPYGRHKFEIFPNCGEPQTCGNISIWGCVPPLVNVNGICQMSVSYQQSCPAGYDALACACNPTPTPTPTPPPPGPGSCEAMPGGCCGDGSRPQVCESNRGEAAECIACPQCLAEFGCGSFIDPNDGRCKPEQCVDCYLTQGGSYCFSNGFCHTPVVIDISGNGFNLTDATNGVWFVGSPGTAPIRTAWTAAASDDAWLVLDRNANGIIDDGAELFSSSAPQPEPTNGDPRNGFLALAVFDLPANGGNGDGKIDRYDAVFRDLQLWTDTNHNGVSEPTELTRLRVSAIRTIELDYRESRREDEHGNKFKYRAKVRDRNGAQVGRWAWDVFPRTVH